MATAAESDPRLEHLLEHIRRTRGSDFTGYKRASLTRRLDKRMQAVGAADYDEYLDRLEVDPDEFGHLFDTILINVTSFFRDAPVWDALTEQLRTRVVAAKGPDEPIRVWSAGTSSGQEAYTLAIVLAELLGAEEFRSRVKIYGTDVDEDALATARRACYGADDLDAVPEHLRDRYFEQVGDELCFRPDLRRAVIFGRHDLVQDAPISRLDLLVCRNTLMYLNAETQTRVLERFHFALAEHGLFMVGQAETLMARSDRFAPLDLRSRLFVRAADRDTTDRYPYLMGGPVDITDAGAGGARLIELSFDAVPVPGLLVDAEGRVAHVNATARHLLRLSERDVGRPFQDLDVSYRPIELRSSIEVALQEQRAVVHRDVEATLSQGQPRTFDIEVMPVLEPGGRPVGVSITFDDVTRDRELKEELADSKRQLEAAYEELQSTNEELETTNEELQSTIEELETTNEELQSTNEELETMNEELQSTNEELHRANEELRSRGQQLDEVNGFLESILGGLQRAVVVVDTDFTVQIWNERAEDLWGLRRDEVIGRNFLSLDIGLPVHELGTAVRSAFDGLEAADELAIDAHNRRGQRITCATLVSPRRTSAGAVAGALLLMREEPAVER